MTVTAQPSLSAQVSSPQFEELLIRADRAQVIASLARGMAHDLRGPLQTLTLLVDPNADLLGGPEGARLRQAVSESVQHLADTIGCFSRGVRAAGDRSRTGDRGRRWPTWWTCSATSGACPRWRPSWSFPAGCRPCGGTRPSCAISCSRSSPTPSRPWRSCPSRRSGCWPRRKGGWCGSWWKTSGRLPAAVAADPFRPFVHGREGHLGSAWRWRAAWPRGMAAASSWRPPPRAAPGPCSGSRPGAAGLGPAAGAGTPSGLGTGFLKGSCSSHSVPVERALARGSPRPPGRPVPRAGC